MYITNHAVGSRGAEGATAPLDKLQYTQISILGTNQLI